MKYQKSTFSLFMMLIITMFLILTVASHAKIDRATIAALWLFDEGRGDTINDLSGNENHAEAIGKPKWVNGKFGSRALLLDGEVDYVAAPGSESLNITGDQLSIVAWVKGEEWPADDTSHIIRKVADNEGHTTYLLRVDQGMLRTHVRTIAGMASFGGQAILPINEWVHVAMVYNGQQVHIYVDGELDRTVPAMMGALGHSDNGFWIGSGLPYGNLQGAVDEVAIFSSALTKNDIRSLKIRGLRRVLLLPAFPVEPSGKLTTTWASIKL